MNLLKMRYNDHLSTCNINTYNLEQFLLMGLVIKLLCFLFCFSFTTYLQTVLIFIIYQKYFFNTCTQISILKQAIKLSKVYLTTRTLGTEYLSPGS